MLIVIRIIADEALERSSVVANCAMNRERSLTGSNGYGRELGIDVLTILLDQLARAPAVRWLDLCCGTGRALVEAAARLDEHGVADRVEILGVDLVDHFAGPPRPPTLQLLTASVTSWTPAGPFDLITSVHGLHYVGDKLGALTRAASWLTDDGLFVANLDTRGVLHPDGTPIGPTLTAELRRRVGGGISAAAPHRSGREDLSSSGSCRSVVRSWRSTSSARTGGARVLRRRPAMPMPVCRCAPDACISV
jgi:SAM-dependent methyltransferase